MKINYTYTEYKDFPVATEISESRARNAIALSMLSFCGIFVSGIMLILYKNLTDLISCIATMLVFVALLIYLNTYYPKMTEKKIKKAIESQIKLERNIRESKYKCKSITILDRFATGTCNYCYENNQRLTLCKIRTDIGTREIYICSSCIRRFKETNNK